MPHVLPTQYVVDLVGIEPTVPKDAILQTAEANHIAHKIQNLVCPEGFEPSTTWFQTKYATRLRYGQRVACLSKLSSHLYLNVQPKCEFRT